MVAPTYADQSHAYLSRQHLVRQNTNRLRDEQTLPDELVRNEAAWKLWYAENEPEEVPVPYFEGRLAADPSVGAFYRLLLVR